MAVVSTISLIDSYSNPAKKMAQSASNLKDNTQKASSAVDKLGSKVAKVKTDGIEKAAKNLKNLDSALSKVEKSIRKAGSALRKMGPGVKVRISGIAQASKKTTRLFLAISKVRRGLKKLSRSKTKPKVDLKDHVTSKISKIGGKLKKFAHANFVTKLAVGSAKAIWNAGTELENQKRVMTHVLGGDESKSAAYMKSLRENANATPFETGEVVQAGTRAIQIAEGDTKSAMELVKLAEDMAALNPGKSISDAMEALGDAKMGEIEGLKEFGFKGSKELFDESGGDIFAMKSQNGKSLTEMYAGGTETLSKSASGLVSTATGTIKSGFADASLQVLDRLKPAFEKMIPMAEKVGGALPKLADAIMDKVIPAFHFVFEQGQVLVSALKPIFDGVVGAVTPIISVLSNYASPVISKVVDIVSGLKPAFEVLGSAVSVVGNVIGFVLQPVLDTLVGALGFLGDAISIVINAFKWLADKVKNFFGEERSDEDKAEDKARRQRQFDFIGGLPKRNATGTNYFEGGRTIINELGEEMIDLPRGSRIYPAGETKDIIKKEVKNSNRNSNRVMNFTFHITTGGMIDEQKLGDIIYDKFKLAYENA